MKKILIASIHDSSSHNGPSFNEIVEITKKSTEEYCKFHGYDQIIENEKLDKNRHISWNRIALLRKYLENNYYDWVWNTDIDLMIMNQTIKLENFLDENYDILITCYRGDIEHFNSGSFIVNNTAWSREFLKNIYEHPNYLVDRDFVAYEQECIIEYYKSRPDEQKHFKIMETRTINSHFHARMSDITPSINYEYGDFVLHTAGSDNDYRVPTFKELEKWIIKPGEPLKDGFNVLMWDK